MKMNNIRWVSDKVLAIISFPAAMYAMVKSESEENRRFDAYTRDNPTEAK